MKDYELKKNEPMNVTFLGKKKAKSSALKKKKEMPWTESQKHPGLKTRPTYKGSKYYEWEKDGHRGVM